jgi:hypothetical protein
MPPKGVPRARSSAGTSPSKTASQDRPEDARQFLASVYDRFTEGFETVDLRVAKGLLDDLQNSKNVGAV